MDSNEHEHAELIELSEIYKELTQDAMALTEDLVDSIEMWPYAAGLCFLLAMVTVWFSVLPNWNTGSFSFLFYGFLSVVFVLAGIYAIRKYFILKKKYSRLFKIRKQLEEESEDKSDEKLEEEQ